jgi:NAD(P)-dependent dehydrogenase (short-subunit alcohol dehydrogenase family)
VVRTRPYYSIASLSVVPGHCLIPIRELTTRTANSGIGFGLAALLIEDPSKLVILCSRSVSKGEAALKDLQARNLPGSVELLQLDVTDEKSIAAAAKKVEETHGRLDALVNNAGIASFPPGTSMKEQMQQSFLVNATGVQLVTDAFRHLLKKSTTPRIINVSSGAGSVGIRLNPSFDHPLIGEVIHYRASKAAENMVAANMYRQLDPLGWKVFTYNPGFTESNLGPRNKVSEGAKSTADGARPMVAMLNGEKDQFAGKNVTSEWTEHPW